jgi:hypothetical protein
MLTSVSLRLALERLAEIRCGTAPSSIRVAVVPCGTDRTYVVPIPFEYRTEVYQFLVDSTDVSPPLDGGPLILSPDQASAIVHLAYCAERNPSPLDSWTSVPKMVERVRSDRNARPAAGDVH